MTTPRIIFMGTPNYAARYLEGLIAADLTPSAVITQPDRPAGRTQSVEPTPVKLFALKHNIPVYQPEDIRELQWTEKIRELAPELIVVVAFGQIIPQSILDIPPYGCINVHPSLLPRHRGATPWQEIILLGDAIAGVTIMLMDEKMDHGPILSQEKIDVAQDETAKSLEKKTAAVGIPLLIGTLEQWFMGTIVPNEQKHEEATYTRLLKKESGKIDWSKSAIEIERMVRAMEPWPGTWTEWCGKRVKILDAVAISDDDMVITDVNCGDFVPSLDENNKPTLFIPCRQGYLQIRTLQMEGRKPMSAEEFIHGRLDPARSLSRVSPRDRDDRDVRRELL